MTFDGGNAPSPMQVEEGRRQDGKGKREGKGQGTHGNSARVICPSGRLGDY